MRVLARSSSFVVVMLVTALAHAQSGVRVELDEVTDNRVTGDGLTGSLELRVKLNGTGLDKAAAARVIVKEAKDDRGNKLGESFKSADFMPREYNNGTLQVSIKQPARAASSVRIKGTVELYVPSKDPNAIVKIDKGLSKLDAPLTAKGLKAANITVTPLSRAGYDAAMKSRKVTDKDVEHIRAEGKKAGASDKEIEAAIELAKAFSALDSDPPENAVIFSGKSADFDRIFRVEILGNDGKPVDTTGRSTSSRGEASLMTIQPSQPLPPNATLQFSLLTDKSRVSFPFELNVPLP